MREYRFLGGSLLTALLLAACSETQPTLPGPDAELAQAAQACVITDDPAAQVRTVTAGCLNTEVAAPEGWTLRVRAAPPPSPLRFEVSPQFTAVPNPDEPYIDDTDLIDISGIADFTNLTQITHNGQTVTFSVTMNKRSVPGSWATWSCPPFSETCTPHLLFSQGATTVEMTIAEPTGIFGFEVNPNPFSLETYTAEFYDGANLVGTITREIHGDGGARLMAARAPEGVRFDRVVLNGTADFGAANFRYGEGDPTDPPIEVDIHDVYSGDPRQAPGTISIDDEWVYVEILDPLSYRPDALGAIPFQTADQVRIGDSWETGTPAESYVLLDLTGNQVTDIRLRWSLQQLVDDGNLTCATTTVVVWGRDGATEYRGEHAVQVIDCPIGEVCFDNGGFVTHPGAGAGGADVSMASPDPHNAAGSNVRLQPGGPHFRIADDFVLTTACAVTRVVVHGYETGQANPNWSQANLNIWDHGPPFTGNPVGSATTTTWVWSGVYRTFNGVLINTDRPVQEIHFDFPDLVLQPGTYWIDWQVEGGVSGWANYRMEPNPANPNAPFTVFDNGQQMTVGGVWQPILDAPGAETPFQVHGGPPPPAAGRGIPLVSRGWRPPAGYGTQAVDSPQ